MEKNYSQEKRKDKRVRKEFGLLYKAYREIKVEQNLSHIIDISKSGLSFLTPQEFLRNDILQMIFRLPPDFKEKIEILGRVVESVPTVQRGFKTRVSFINVDPGAKTMLSQMIEKSGAK